jgi:hypothetical protein
VSTTCPADAKVPNGTACTADSNPCTLDQCDGSSVDCQHPAGNAGATCRGAAGVCDVAETCTGTSTTCPADSVAGAFTECRPAADQCDVGESCDGSSTDCPADASAPNGTPCNDGLTCTSPDSCQGGVCTGTPDVDACADDYLCYKVKTKIAPILNVHLVDQFEDVRFDLRKVKNLCTPANKNAEGVNDTVTHQQSYRLKAIPGSPRFTRQLGVKVVNQLGTLFVDAYKRDFLLVPTNKSLGGPTTPPDNNAINVDHYKCYKAKTTAGTPRFTVTSVTVGDQFTSPAKFFTVKKIKHLCTPVDKNGEGIKNSGVHLLCYQAKVGSGQPKHVRRTGVNTNGQLGPAVLGTLKESELCVPGVSTP